MNEVNLKEVFDKNPSIAVDIDGVLCKKRNVFKVGTFGDVIPGAQDFVKQLRSKYRIVIYTCRITPCTDITDLPQEELISIVEKWLKENNFEYDELWTGPGKPFVMTYIDDLAITCIPEEEVNSYNKVLQKLNIIHSNNKSISFEVFSNLDLNELGIFPYGWIEQLQNTCSINISREECKKIKEPCFGKCKKYLVNIDISEVE